MISQFKKAAIYGSSIALLGGVATAGAGAAALAQNNNGTSDPSRYIVVMHPLNNSGVSGFGRLTMSGNDIGVSLNAHGLIPGQVHMSHIHGTLDGSDATCPTTAQDTNHDGFVSVFEGATTYGPIKLNLTSPQTPFGPNPNAKLFAPFAGVPNMNNFPMTSANGGYRVNQDYTFDMSKADDAKAFSSLTPLDHQHIVIHGAFAPQNVDTEGGGSQQVYDPLLPVACGEIIMTHQGTTGSDNGNGNTNGNGTGTGTTGTGTTGSGGSSISNTGPGSTNQINNNASTQTSITNTNNVSASSNNNQTSSSGSANAQSNTEVGGASSGSASNNSSSSTTVNTSNNGSSGGMNMNGM